jgi:hypothetical protein
MFANTFLRANPFVAGLLKVYIRNNLPVDKEPITTEDAIEILKGLLPTPETINNADYTNYYNGNVSFANTTNVSLMMEPKQVAAQLITGDRSMVLQPKTAGEKATEWLNKTGASANATLKRAKTYASKRFTEAGEKFTEKRKYAAETILDKTAPARRKVSKKASNIKESVTAFTQELVAKMEASKKPASKSPKTYKKETAVDAIMAERKLGNDIGQNLRDMSRQLAELNVNGNKHAREAMKKVQGFVEAARTGENIEKAHKELASSLRGGRETKSLSNEEKAIIVLAGNILLDVQKAKSSSMSR